MKSYLTYFKLKFISGLQYRAAAIAGICTQFFFGFVYIMVYIAFFESGNPNTPMTLSQTITYLWLNQAFFALVNQFYKDKDKLSYIKTVIFILVRFLTDLFKIKTRFTKKIYIFTLNFSVYKVYL